MTLLDYCLEQSWRPVACLEKGRMSVGERKNDGHELDGQREVQEGG